ncbi:MAG: c-type cytochrome [Paracoccaceae bacterium]
MTIPRRYVVGGALTCIAIAAMAWSAVHPAASVGAKIVARTDAALSNVVDFFQLGPVEGHEDWASAALAIYQGNATRGADLMIDYGCGACHVIPGVVGARGTVGPHLGGFGDQAYIGGVLPNRPDGLVQWLIDPPRHASETAMPDLGVSENHARDMAAYLYTLTGGRG